MKELPKLLIDRVFDTLLQKNVVDDFEFNIMSMKEPHVYHG